jgi:LmbE family N-acetylglucosaminyl deacetylase
MEKSGLKVGTGEKTILCIGAHPDDCEFSCSGTAALWAASGNRVVFVSATDGRSGHHVMSGERIVSRRKTEARQAASVIGAESRMLPFQDGSLEPSFENRLEVIRAIREIAPDVIITNRPNDYHPDHRYTAQLVQDSAYMLMVPNILSEVQALQYNPIILYWSDTFTYPKPFHADVVVNVDSVLEKKLEMLACHESQVYEWLPFVAKYPEPVPEGKEERRAWLRRFFLNWTRASVAETYRHELCQRYGDDAGRSVQHAEAFEICEYGTVPDDALLADLFQEL